MPSSVRDDSSLGLRISGLPYLTEYLWHPQFDLLEDWQLEIPPAVGPLANYDLFSFRKVSFGMSYQELIDTLGDPSEQWNIPIPEKNEEIIKDLISGHINYLSERVFTLGFFNIPAVEKYLDRLSRQSEAMQRNLLAKAKIGSPMFLYFDDYPEFVFYLVTVKLPIGINSDRQEYNRVSFLQDIYDLHAFDDQVGRFPLISFTRSKGRNVYRIRIVRDKNGKKVEEYSPIH